MLIAAVLHSHLDGKFWSIDAKLNFTKLNKFTVTVWAICRRKAETQDLAKVWGKAEKMRDTRKLEIWRHADKKTQEDVILGQKNCCGS